MIINRFLSPSYSIQPSVWRRMRSLLTCGEADVLTSVKYCLKTFLFFNLFVEVREFFHRDPTLLPSVYYCFSYSGDPKFKSRLWQSVLWFLHSYIASFLRVMPDDINQTRTASFHIPWYLLFTGRLFIKRGIIWALESSLTLWRRNYILILAHPVYKMWIIQEPNKLALWNKLHFEEKKTESIEHV